MVVVERVLARAAGTNVERVVHRGRDRSGRHVLRNGEATATKSSDNDDDGDDNADNGSRTETSGEGDNVVGRSAAVDAGVAVTADALKDPGQGNVACRQGGSGGANGR